MGNHRGARGRAYTFAQRTERNCATALVCPLPATLAEHPGSLLWAPCCSCCGSRRNAHIYGVLWASCVVVSGHWIPVGRAVRGSRTASRESAENGSAAVCFWPAENVLRVPIRLKDNRMPAQSLCKWDAASFRILGMLVMESSSVKVMAVLWVQEGKESFYIRTEYPKDVPVAC